MTDSIKKNPNSDDPTATTGVDIGDELYFHHAGEPRSGRVVAHGKHGCTLDCDGKHHPVKWDRVLGHKKRASQHYSVVDQGEDGMIVEDASGKKRFISVPGDAREDQMVAKSFDGRQVLFLKAEGQMKGRAGLSQKKVTDKTGRQQTKWVRSSKEEDGKGKRAAPEGGAVAPQGKAGDKVSFEAGDFKGSGTIVGTPGKDGAYVKDASGRVHQVRWSEMAGPGIDDGEKKPATPEQPKGADDAKDEGGQKRS